MYTIQRKMTCNMQVFTTKLPKIRRRAKLIKIDLKKYSDPDSIHYISMANRVSIILGSYLVLALLIAIISSL